MHLPTVDQLPAVPHVRRELVSPWSMAAMNAYLDSERRRNARRSAREAEQRIADGAAHADVMGALGAAETLAPADERPWHAARLDAYADHYGLRGWYRYTDYRGEHRVQVNFIRTREDGERGRYYVTDYQKYGPREWRAVDRDTGDVAYQHTNRSEVQSWINRAEGVPPDIVDVHLPDVA
ncbi:hypothetical protein [Marinitenerispora sediminis]|uniref:Uncharacterized protein n=1 Tax=Marinitenerispora sediminis TaxID=1931232 RepID=A0A368T6P9_9ACTN|nr:hypothetical protein [Marinitenerispora sediminis]RCV51191.1 hypothetical protein DEF23_20930 [Marinitenerispora sediminis]RCV59328.1 hypothetical protein DEF24_10170 [Marinitenerispora sediminis]